MPDRAGHGDHGRGRAEGPFAGRQDGRGRPRRDGRAEAQPERRQGERDECDGGLGRPGRHRDQADDAQADPQQRDQAQRDVADREPGEERTERGGTGQGPERETLLVGPAVQDTVDEDRATDDRGRERVAREQRHEGSGGEGRSREQPRVEERIGVAPRAHDREHGDDGGRE